MSFLSTFPLRGTSPNHCAHVVIYLISIHVPLAGNVSPSCTSNSLWPYFYPRSPCGERHPQPCTFISITLISIHVPLAGNVLARDFNYDLGFGISIHVPLAGNVDDLVAPVVGGSISIHVPLAGNVIDCHSCGTRLYQFLSTFPLRGTSRGGLVASGQVTHFYPRSPCGERLDPSPPPLALRRISIHVPLAGNVETAGALAAIAMHFYPRSPCGERPSVCHGLCAWSIISIHVPLAGNVVWTEMCGAINELFLSTFPLRGTSRGTNKSD